jgi:hypothetical protein
VGGVIVDYHDLAPIIGPIHGLGSWSSSPCPRGAAAGWWRSWHPAVTPVTAGPRHPPEDTIAPARGPRADRLSAAILTPSAAVAQLARASACHAEGRGFESHQPLSEKPRICGAFSFGAELRDGLREGPGYIAFARENGTIYHTYTVMAPDPFVAPHFNMLLERTPKPQPEEPRAWRKDEYPDWTARP